MKPAPISVATAKVNTYDVHLFLKGYQGAVEVPAGGSVSVEVTITHHGADRIRLEKENPCGAYIEAFIEAVPLATDDGELLPTLSLPMLAFYGDRPNEIWFFRGNPIVPDLYYMPERNAINVERGDYF